RHLGGEGRRLARALEAHVAGRGPGQHVAALVGEGDDRVVEAALDVGDAVADVLPLALARPAPAGGLGLGHYLRTFFLPATVFFGPLRVRALVWVRWPRTGRPRRCRSPCQQPISIFRLMSCWTSRRRSPSTLNVASMWLRMRATSSSVRSRTRVSGLMSSAEQISCERVRPMP